MVRFFYPLAMALSVIGAINWGIVGLFGFNPVRRLLGAYSRVERGVYLLVGLAGSALGVGLAVSGVLSALGLRGHRLAQVLEGRSLVGHTLPGLEGTTVSGERVALPHHVQGKIAFLVMGFSYDARWNVENWSGAFQDRFGNNPAVTFFEIPVIPRLYRLFGPMIDAGMRRATPADRQGHVLAVYASPGAIREALRASFGNDTWVFLLDRDGRVLYQYGGPYDERTFEDMVTLVESSITPKRAPGLRRAA